MAVSVFVLLFSSLQVTHPTGMGFDFIMIVPLLLSLCSFFVFGHVVPLFGGFQCSPIDGCSTASCNFGALAGGDARTPFYSAILNWKKKIWAMFLTQKFLSKFCINFWFQKFYNKSELSAFCECSLWLSLSVLPFGRVQYM